MTTNAPLLPERVVLNAMQLGLAAVTAELVTSPTLGEATFDRAIQFPGMADAELTKARARWVQADPQAIMGYPRQNSPFPLFSLVLGSDVLAQDYIGLSERIMAEDEIAGLEGRQPVYSSRNKAQFMAIAYAQHPDVVVWMYRVMRLVMHMAVPYLSARGCAEPQLSGADLVPKAEQSMDNLFMRRLTIEVEYVETWANSGPVWEALNGAAEGRLTTGGTVDIRHEDSAPYPGTVHFTDEFSP